MNNIKDSTAFNPMCYVIGIFKFLTFKWFVLNTSVSLGLAFKRINDRYQNSPGSEPENTK